MVSALTHDILKYHIEIQIRIFSNIKILNIRKYSCKLFIGGFIYRLNGNNDTTT